MDETEAQLRMMRLLSKHLPGQHDQATHGYRYGNSDGSGRSIDKYRDQYAAKYKGLSVGDATKKMSADGLIVLTDMFKQHVNGSETAADEAKLNDEIAGIAKAIFERNKTLTDIGDPTGGFERYSDAYSYHYETQFQGRPDQKLAIIDEMGAILHTYMPEAADAGTGASGDMAGRLGGLTKLLSRATTITEGGMMVPAEALSAYKYLNMLLKSQ